MQHPSLHRRAFTLVELAIALVIIGLILGGIFVGTSVLKQSELQTVIADYTKYTAATTQFTQQYGGLPGDLLDATNYWGDDNANCPDAAVTNGNPGTCNGDGDSVIGSLLTERPRAWQHLQLAKLIDGNFTGTGATAAIGTNVPRSRILNAGWSFSNNSGLVGTSDSYNQKIDNFLGFGSLAPYPSSNIVKMTIGAAITPTEAWQVDKKIDDALPATGRVIALKPGSTAMPNCTDSAVDASAKYNITKTDKLCGLLMSLTTK